jgi:predicted alpha-1,2-mannosidase
MTLEHAYDDSCMAAFAADRGMAAEHAVYASRANNYLQHWNPAVGFMQPKNRDGSWTEPFDPESTEFNGFVEASSWTFSFFVPHDVPALVDLMGGPQAFVERLDQYFAGGYYDPSNQPSFHIPWLYNYAGAPSKTQDRVRRVLDEHFHAGPDGLPGNDDAGAMSAWFVLGALGLYPVSPGDPVYQIASPIVDRATIHLNPTFYAGGTFVIETENNAPDHPYIQSASLNGAPLDRTWITHDEIARGGTLHMVLGANPSSWGTD